MVADAGKVSFQPKPVVVRADPVVRYTVNAPAGGQETFDYDVPVASGVVTLARLQGWAADQAREAAAYRSQAHVTAPVTLVRMQISPTTLQLTAGAPAHKLALRGLMSNSHAANLATLSKARWTSSAPSVAGVAQDGTLTPLSAGKATITAMLGTVKATMVVNVAAPVAASTPAEGQVPGSFSGTQSSAPKNHATATKTRSRKVTSTAHPKPDPVPCPAPSVLVAGQCVPVEPPPPSPCGSPSTLVNGVCESPPPAEACDSPSTVENGVCVTPDPVCDPPSTPVDGVCVTPDPVPTVTDPGTPSDSSSSPDPSTDDSSTGIGDPASPNSTGQTGASSSPSASALFSG
jgi:uncharacterized protein YjdB